MSVNEVAAPDRTARSTPFRSVVVGFHGPDRGPDALALGELVAHADGARLTAVSVYVYRPIHGYGDPDYEDVLRAEARGRVASAADLASAPRPAVDAARGHSRAEGLYRYAIEHHADLIVVGTTHRNRAGRALARSVPEALLHAGPCAVAVAPPDYASWCPGRIDTIGVGFDGGEESRAALRTAARLARTTGARLEVMSVIEPGLDFTETQVTGMFPRFEYETLARERREQDLASAVEELQDVDATGSSCDGTASDVFADRSRGLDLLVLGSRRYGVVRRVLLGSTSSATIHHALCPVLVVPRTGIASPASAPSQRSDEDPT